MGDFPETPCVDNPKIGNTVQNIYKTKNKK